MKNSISQVQVSVKAALESIGRWAKKFMQIAIAQFC